MTDKPEPDVMGVRDIDRLYRAQSELYKMDGDDLTPELEERVVKVNDELRELMADVGLEMYFSNTSDYSDNRN